MCRTIRFGKQPFTREFVRDRVKALIDGGATLQQVRTARVTADYDTQFVANTGAWMTDMFVEAVYSSVKAAPAKR